MNNNRLKSQYPRFVCGLMTAALIVIFAGITPAQVKTKTGTVNGTIFLKSISGNLGTTLHCYDFYVHTVPDSPLAAQASGDITSGQCTYSLHAVAERNFVVEIAKPNIFKKCDSGVFTVDGMFRQKIKRGEERIINITVRNIYCSVVK
jgi:hypothetical protein